VLRRVNAATMPDQNDKIGFASSPCGVWEKETWARFLAGDVSGPFFGATVTVTASLYLLHNISWFS